MLRRRSINASSGHLKWQHQFVHMETNIRPKQDIPKITNFSNFPYLQSMPKASNCSLVWCQFQIKRTEKNLGVEAKYNLELYEYN